MPAPIYSHGGTSVTGFPAVPGTSPSSGRPIVIINATKEPVLRVAYTGTSVTFVVEGNGGLYDPSTFSFPAGEWDDISSGGFTLTNGQTLGKYLPLGYTAYRTRITAISAPTGNGLVTYVPFLIRGDQQIGASYPSELTTVNFGYTL